MRVGISTFVSSSTVWDVSLSAIMDTGLLKKTVAAASTPLVQEDTVLIPVSKISFVQMHARPYWLCVAVVMIYGTCNIYKHQGNEVPVLYSPQPLLLAEVFLQFLLSVNLGGR